MSEQGFQEARPKATWSWSRAITASALLYGALAWGTMRLLFDSGFAMPFWPAAGLALGLALGVGIRALPGIALGSLGANLAIWAAGDPSLGQALPVAWHLAAVGAGAALQAGLGAMLIQRLTHSGATLLTHREIATFLLLGGPLACALNATVAVQALADPSLFGPADPTTRWWTWWLGDVAGVFLVAPATWSLLSRQQEAWSGRVVSLNLGLLASALLLGLLLRATIDGNDRRLSADLGRLADSHAAALDTALAHAEEIADTVATFLEGHTQVEASAFSTFVQRPLDHNPAIRAVSWNPMASSLDWAVPVAMIEPEAGNEQALGYDIASEPRRRRAIARALQTGQVSATAPIELVQADGDGTGVLLLAPVRAPNGQTRGFAVIVVDLQGLLSQALSADGEQFAARLSDVTDGTAMPLGRLRTAQGEWSGVPEPWRHIVQVGGRSWALEQAVTSAHLSARRAFLSAGTMVVGVVLAGLVSALMLLITGRGNHERRQLRALQRQVEERQRAEVALSEARDLAEHQASHDEITGLVNRRRFEQVLDDLAATVHGTQRRHALAFLDLDRFKLVNDTVGHAAGDALLRQVADLLRGHIRAADTLGRIGGDEFGLLLPDCPLDRAVATAERLVHALSAHRFLWDGRPFAIGASIGVVGIAEDSRGTGTLLAQADVACYAAKDAGRGRVHVYEGPDQSARHRHAEILTASVLQDAIDSDRLRLVRQPICSLAEPQRIVRYEILVRMLKPDGTLALPATFIPAAERFGLVGALDRWVVARALDSLARWPEDQRIAINLSGASLADEGLQRFVLSALDQRGFEPGRVGFEVTETAAIRNLAKAVRFIGELRDRGCRFALDDFGSGLASFAYLKNLPVDALKIDGVFTRDLDDPTQQILVRAIHDLAQALGIKTVAEGAETPEIVQRMRALGLELAQGYALGRPDVLPKDSSAA